LRRRLNCRFLSKKLDLSFHSTFSPAPFSYEKNQPLKTKKHGLVFLLSNAFSEIKFTKMNRLKLFYLLIFSAIALPLFFGEAQAQTASVAISPASIDAKVKPGVAYTQNFTITNNTNTRLRFRCALEDMWYDEKNKRLTGRAGTLPRSASLWTQFSPSEIIVEPNSSAVVKAVITVPPSATGSFNAVPVFEGLPVEKPAAVSVVKTNSATANIGIKFRGLILLTTTEGAEYNVEIMGGRIEPPTAAAELEINLDLRNRGTAHARVRGAFAVLDAAGKLVGRGSINEKRYLPTQRDFLKGGWSGELAPGNYICVITLSYDRVGSEPMSLVYEIPFNVKK
jgi:hypothetical protein